MTTAPYITDEIRDWHLQTATARNAYFADMEVQDGRCETGCGRKIDRAHRRCHGCRYAKAVSA